MFKKLFIAVLLLSGTFFIQNLTLAQDDSKTESKTEASDEPVGIKMEDGILYGKDYDHGMQIVEFSDLMKDADNNKDKTVLVKGDVTEVCQAMGCWMILSDGTNETRVTTLHNFFLPKDVAGTKAVVIGKFIETEISEDQAKHYNEESKNPKMKTEDIKGSSKVYEIEAVGIKILNPEDKN
ncbi:MAG: DUF4920 domain-containing protein [Bacteroidetes bacterium]|nr:DUF4920 domain-containing protein [Bacteroidota bacterium]